MTSEKLLLNITQQLLVHDSVGEAVSCKVSGWVRLVEVDL